MRIHFVRVRHGAGRADVLDIRMLCNVQTGLILLLACVNMHANTHANMHAIMQEMLQVKTHVKTYVKTHVKVCA